MARAEPYLADEAVGGGVGRRASIGALESALPLGVLPLRMGEKKRRRRRTGELTPSFQKAESARL